MKPTRVSFEHFLEKFPEVELPVTLGENSHHAFSQINDPLPQLMIEQIIEAIEDEPLDEWTEIVACFRIPETRHFYAIVYWKAGLMNYQYILATFTKKGELIDKRVLAGTFSDGKTVIQSVATIDEDWTILVVSGQSGAGQQAYDAVSSKTYHLELLPEGHIVND